MRLLVRLKLLGVPQTLFPLLKGELKGEEALEGPKSASPEGRIIAVCRGLLADMPSNGKRIKFHVSVLFHLWFFNNKQHTNNQA